MAIIAMPAHQYSQKFRSYLPIKKNGTKNRQDRGIATKMLLAYCAV